MTEIIIAGRNNLTRITHFFPKFELFGKVPTLLFQEFFQCVSRVFQECFRRVRVFLASFSQKDWKIPMLLQKVLQDWFTLPERQELFPGLPPPPPPLK